MTYEDLQGEHTIRVELRENILLILFSLHSHHLIEINCGLSVKMVVDEEIF